MKKMNKTGFTLIELLAVIIILAILIAVAVPAVTRYLNGARKDTFVSNAKSAIQAVADEVTINGMQSTGGTLKTKWTKAEINALLDTQLKQSPFGQDYDDTSYVAVAEDATTGKYTYSICLTDKGHNGFSSDAGEAIDYDSITSENIKVGNAVACQ